MLTDPDEGLELVWLPDELEPDDPPLVGFDELLPAASPACDELDVDGLLPPNIDPPDPVEDFPPLEVLDGLLLVLPLDLLPPNIDPPDDRLDDPLLRGRLEPELELRPFWARTGVEQRKATAKAQTSRFGARISDIPARDRARQSGVHPLTRDFNHGRRRLCREYSPRIVSYCVGGGDWERSWSGL